MPSPHSCIASGLSPDREAMCASRRLCCKCERNCVQPARCGRVVADDLVCQVYCDGCDDRPTRSPPACSSTCEVTCVSVLECKFATMNRTVNVEDNPRCGNPCPPQPLRLCSPSQPRSDAFGQRKPSLRSSAYWNSPRKVDSGSAYVRLL